MLGSRRLQVTIGSLIFLIASGTVMFHSLENWTWIQSFYFTVATLTTVGYGDIHPSSDTTRLVVAIFIILGVGVAVTALSVVSEAYIKKRSKD